MSENLARHFLLRDDITFLNHGSYGACPRPVFEAYQAWQLELEREPVEFLSRKLTENMRLPREALAAEFGTSPENLVGVTNATTGLNIVARSLDLKPGDQILTTDHEYSALEKTWAYICRKTGAQLVMAKIPLPLETEAQFTNALVDRMTERTKVLFLSHITSATALVFPIAPAIAEARRRGIISIIDGAHAPGQIPLELDTLGADFYAGNCHKWMMAPKGSAFLHARPEVQHLVEPLVISHGWTPQSKEPGARGTFGNSPFVDEIEMQGTRDPAPWLAVAAALKFRADNDWWALIEHCRALAQETGQRVTALTGLPALSTPEFCAPQMVAMLIPNCDPPALHKTLFERYGIEIPVYRWQDHSITRVSVQAYNSRPQMDKLIAALSEIFGLKASR